MSKIYQRGNQQDGKAGSKNIWGTDERMLE